MDPNEWADTDGDATGDNADTDDDNDGYSDQDEISCQSDPLDANNAPLDFDKYIRSRMELVEARLSQEMQQEMQQGMQLSNTCCCFAPQLRQGGAEGAHAAGAH